MRKGRSQRPPGYMVMMTVVAIIVYVSMEDTTTHNEDCGVFAALAYFYAWQCIHNDVQCIAMIILYVG